MLTLWALLQWAERHVKCLMFATPSFLLCSSVARQYSMLTFHLFLPFLDSSFPPSSPFISTVLSIPCHLILPFRNNLIQNSLILHWVPAQAPSAHQPWLYATQSQNTAVQCGLDPTTRISSTPNFTVQCA